MIAGAADAWASARYLLSGGPGGWVLVAIFGVSLGAWIAMLRYGLRLREEIAGGFRWAEDAIERAERGDQSGAAAACAGRATVLARVLGEALSWPAVSRRFFDKHLWPLVESETQQLRGPLTGIGACAALLPLLGLLGTVLGMVEAFDALGGVGASGPKRLAGGISQALWTTQAGLVAAVPVLLGQGYLSARWNHYADRVALFVKRAERALVVDGGGPGTGTGNAK